MKPWKNQTMHPLLNAVSNVALCALTLLGLLLTFNTRTVEAATVVYEQPPSGTGGVVKSAWYPPDGLDGDAYCYDSFVLDSNQAITEIRWRGGYTNFLSGAGKSPVYDFTVSIYPSISFGSEPAITGPPLMSRHIGNNAGETLAGTFGGIPMYDYKFVLPSPFQATAGVKYWVEIVASQGLTPTYYWPPDWGLAYGTGGDGGHFYAVMGGYDGGMVYSLRSGDTAFSLLAADAPTFTIAASVSPSNAGTITGAGAYPSGSIATLVAKPKAGYGFAKWTENGVQVSTSATYSFTVTTNRTLVANFVPAYTITTSSSPSYGGSTRGGGKYNKGTSATVVAKPALGYLFVNWTEYGTEVSTSASYTFTVNANRTLVANFTLDSRSATFDFDTGTPALSNGQGTPIDQTSSGITAHFSSPSDGSTPAYSVQTDSSTFYTLSQFSGHYLLPSSVFRTFLDIKFNRQLSRITLIFATADFHQVEIPSTIKLTAYVDSTATTAVGAASTHGTYASDTMPMGRLSFSSATPYNLVRIELPYAPQGATDFLVDNVTVTRVVAPAPTISSFTPASGAVGMPITINGTDFTGATAVTFNGINATTFTVDSNTQITVRVPSGATTGPIAVTTDTGTGTSLASFIVVPRPTISSFTPASGSVGMTVTITGTNLTNATTPAPQVRFGTIAATTITVISSGKVKAVVPIGAVTAKIKVTTSGGTAASATSFIVVPRPTITGFTPTSGAIGTTVTITGTDLTNATTPTPQVRFGAIVATTVAVISSGQVTAVVPSGASTAKIKVTTSSGTATSATLFTVTALSPAGSTAP